MQNLDICELHGCGEHAVGCTDDGTFMCEDHLFNWGCKQDMLDESCENFNVEDEDGYFFVNPEVELLDVMFDGARE